MSIQKVERTKIQRTKSERKMKVKSKNARDKNLNLQEVRYTIGKHRQCQSLKERRKVEVIQGQKVRITKSQIRKKTNTKTRQVKMQKDPRKI